LDRSACRVGEPGVEQREWLGGRGEVAGLERRTGGG